MSHKHSHRGRHHLKRKNKDIRVYIDFNYRGKPILTGVEFFLSDLPGKWYRKAARMMRIAEMTK